MIKRIPYNNGTEVVFSSNHDGFYKKIINDVIRNGDTWIDIAVYNITHKDLTDLQNLCSQHDISLRIITNKVKFGKGNYNNNKCEMFYLEQTHCKILLSASYGYIGSYNFTFKDYPDIQCGVEFRDSTILRSIRREIFDSLVYNSYILAAETITRSLNRGFYKYSSKPIAANTTNFINQIRELNDISGKILANTTETYPAFNMNQFIYDVQNGLNKSINSIKFSIFLKEIKDFICNVKRVKFVTEYSIDCGNGITIELFKDSDNWYKNLLYPSYSVEEFIRISTLNFNLTNSQRGPGSLYSIITELGKKDVYISIDFTLDQCKTIEDYSTTEIGKVALLNKLDNNHSKVFLSSYYLHIGSANFSLGSEKNFECGVTLNNKEFLSKFEKEFFVEFINTQNSLWFSSPIITESAIARDVLNSIDYFFDIIVISEYYEKEEVTNKLRRILFNSSKKHLDNLMYNDLTIYQEHGHDASYITFDIEDFNYKIKYDKDSIDDDTIEEFIQYLKELNDFLVAAEADISEYYSEHGVNDKRYLLGEE
ncbi:hypothetical protein [Priestia megaterium]|uniref:hypothetical protein n=1 Tax=Priestia megaterium TaxID=1404 RepID=UPI0025B01212|nr:hypothetical protein [Priestia megaterium]MDN3233422.1 hypothetical protein [Priestia megaterium]